MQCVNHPNIIGFLGASKERSIILIELAHCSLVDALYGNIRVVNVGAAVVPPIKSLEWKLTMILEIANAYR